MLRPHEMSSVVITGPKEVQEAVIKELHRLKILHIVDHSKNELADIGRPLEGASQLSEALVKIRALISGFNIKKENSNFEIKKGFPEIESSIKKINDELNAASFELNKIDEQLSRNEASKQELDVLRNISVPLEALATYKSLVYFTGFVKDKQSAAVLKDELSEITTKFTLFSGLYKKKNLIALFIDAKRADEAAKLLQNENFSAVNFANLGNFKGTASSNLARIDEDTSKLKQKKEEIKNKTVKIAQEYKGFLQAADEFLTEHLEKAEAPLKFASTQSSFLIKGWIPGKDLKGSVERLNKTAKGKIYIDFEPAKRGDNVPVKLKNPKYSKPFEFFIDLYSMPTYKELDPTFFIFLTFPIFFGIMLGDIGYGLVGAVLFWILKKKIPAAKNIFNILILSSFISILFGILFAEFFGLEFEFGLINRAHDVPTMLLLSILIGFVHVNIGFLTGFYNELKSHGLKHAIYAKLAWIVLEIGIAGVFYGGFVKNNILLILAAVLILGAITMLALGEGLIGIVEIFGLPANIVSYARLMAIGLSSVILALIINESAKEFFSSGFVGILVGILLLVVGHVINLALGLLGSFLHSLRLHYVEFFSKFFKGGAKKYQPFGARE